jgi:hypothetical protein
VEARLSSQHTAIFALPDSHFGSCELFWSSVLAVCSPRFSVVMMLRPGLSLNTHQKNMAIQAVLGSELHTILNLR